MSKHLTTLKLSVCAAALAVSFTGAHALAQVDGDLAQVDSDQASDRITVTARRKEENLLETPIAITVFGEEQIEALDLDTIADIQLYTPGFVFESLATTPGRFDQSPRFRGIDIDTGDPFRQTASIFIDGLYLINGANGVSLNDIARVEVIKGPQSAVFGRNTFGGAVNYISKTPGDEFSGDIGISIATRDDFEGTIGLEGPLIADVLSGRISANYHFDGGHYENAAVPGEQLGEEETWSIAGSLFFTPTERFSAKVRVGYFENADGSPASAVIPTTQHNCGPFPPGTRTGVCGKLPINQPAASTQQSDAFFDSLQFYKPLLGARDEFGFERENLTVGGSFDYEIFGNVTLSGLFGYSREDTSIVYDFDQLPQTIFSSANDRQFRMNSQEIRIAGSFFDERVEWTIGGSHFDQKSTNAGGFIFGTSPTISSPVDINLQKVETTGVFGSLAYHITDQLSLTAEGRYQEDKIFDDDDIATGTPDEGEFTNFLPRFILDYQVTPSTLLYASYAEGNNPGGFNGEVSALSASDRAALLVLDPLVEETFDEETLKSYEIGAKHGFANGKGSLSGAVFFMQRVGQQFRTSVTDPTVNSGATVTYFLNRGETDIKGFEAEGNYQVTDHFNLAGTVGYVDAEFQVVADTVFSQYFGTQDAAGQKAPRFPKWSGSASALFEHDLGTGLPLYLRADASFIGRRFVDISNLGYAGGGAILNLRLGIREDNYTFEIFAKNLTDSDIPTGISRSSDAATFFSTFAYRTGLRDRRQFGARINANF